MKVVQGIDKLTLAEVRISSEGIDQRSDLLAEVLFSGQIVQILNATFVFFLHDSCRPFCEDSQLLDDLLIDV